MFCNISHFVDTLTTDNNGVRPEYLLMKNRITDKCPRSRRCNGRSSLVKQRIGFRSSNCFYIFLRQSICSPLYIILKDPGMQHFTGRGFFNSSSQRFYKRLEVVAIHSNDQAGIGTKLSCPKSNRPCIPVSYTHLTLPTSDLV